MSNPEPKPEIFLLQPSDVSVDAFVADAKLAMAEAKAETAVSDAPQLPKTIERIKTALVIGSALVVASFEEGRAKFGDFVHARAQKGKL